MHVTVRRKHEQASVCRGFKAVSFELSCTRSLECVQILLANLSRCRAARSGFIFRLRPLPAALYSISIRNACQ